MKKMLLTALGIFALSLVLNIDNQKISIEKSALADGTCCPELDSTCGLNGTNYEGKYYKKTGSCKEKIEQFFE